MIRGEIYWAELYTGGGSVQAGKRPVVVVSNNVGNYHARIVTVCPMTTAIKRPMPTHVANTHYRYGELVHSTILCENVQTIDKSQFLDDVPVGMLSEEKMQEVDRALAIAVGLVPEYNVLEVHTDVSENVRGSMVDSGGGDSAPVRYRRSGTRHELYGTGSPVTEGDCPGTP